MTRALRILAALALLVALMGAESCRKVDTNRPPDQHKVDPAQKRTVTIRARSSGPYTILVIATDQTTGGVDRYGPEPQVGEYEQTLDYESGARVEIRVLVYGNQADDMQCSIADGIHLDRQRRPKEVLCLLTTSR